VFDSGCIQNLCFETAWYSDKNGNKMSKRLGNVVDPLQQLKHMALMQQDGI
jgi:valyl-tRNA synthetase